MNCPDEITDELVTALAHEIKNPVSLLLANISILKMLDTSNSYSKYYLLMEREMYKINSMVNSLVSLSAGTTRFSCVDMNELINTVAADRILAYSGNPIISVHLSNEEKTVIGDKVSLEIVLSNLIKNAKESIDEVSEIMKGTDYRGIIEISTSIDSDNGKSNFRMTVDDNGVGLNNLEDTQKMGFTTKQNGSGVGLSICRSIIDRHNGSFKLEPRNNGGCRTEILLPLAKS